MSAGADLPHRAGARERRLQPFLPPRRHARAKAGHRSGPLACRGGPAPPRGTVAVRRYAHRIKSLGNWDDARHDGWRPEWERLRMRDPYEVLGVAKTASAAEIKSAFRRQAKKLHPDANKHDPRAAARFAELNAAYEILGEENKRKSFDRGEIDAEGKPRFQGFEGFGSGRGQGNF